MKREPPLGTLPVPPAGRLSRSSREGGRIEVKRPPVVAREQRQRLRFEDGYLVVVTGEGVNGFERIETCESGEGHLVVIDTAQEVRTAEAGDIPHRRKELGQRGIADTRRRYRLPSSRATTG
jgi:hypothetical protein